MNILEFLQLASNIDSFYKFVLIALLIFYTLFGLVLAFQTFSFNRLMEQEGFATIFKSVAILHVSVSFILLLLVVLSL